MPQRSISDDSVQMLGFAHSRGAISPVEVVRLSALRRRMDRSLYDPARLNFHLLQFVTAGCGRHWNDFEAVPLKGGDVHHVRPEQVHAFDAASDHEALLLFFKPGSLTGEWTAPSAGWLSASVVSPAPEVFGLLTRLVRVLGAIDADGDGASDRTLSGAPAAHLLAAVLAGLAAARSVQGGAADPTLTRYADLVSRFDALLDEHHAASRRLAGYTQKLHVTPRTLARACHRVRGVSPKQVIDRRVALAAQRRLVLTPDAVETIGWDLGFSEATNFVKFFRRVAGVTPEAFRRAERPARKKLATLPNTAAGRASEMGTMTRASLPVPG